jgi:isopenicillin N synthase-like dioxygenase
MTTSLRPRRTWNGQTVCHRDLFRPTSFNLCEHILTAATVPNIDLSKYGTPEGNTELAQVLIQAIRTKGFFYVTNFGIPQEAVDRQFSLGQAFYELPLEEKLQYVPDLESGDYNGYRPAGRRVLSGGIPDKTEVWNMASKFQHPP